MGGWIEDRSAQLFAVDDSALYQSLHRMEERGWIVAEWGITELKRRARYYRLSVAGRAQLRGGEAVQVLEVAENVGVGRRFGPDAVSEKVRRRLHVRLRGAVRPEGHRVVAESRLGRAPVARCVQPPPDRSARHGAPKSAERPAGMN